MFWLLRGRHKFIYILDVEQADVICEIEPPIEYDENESSMTSSNNNLYQSQPDHVTSHVDCHPIVMSLKMLNPQKTDFKLHLPPGYTLGIMDNSSDSLFHASAHAKFQLTNEKRLSICVWKQQGIERTIQTNRFHNYKLKTHFSIHRNGKNIYLQGNFTFWLFHFWARFFGPVGVFLVGIF